MYSLNNNEKRVLNKAILTYDQNLNTIRRKCVWPNQNVCNFIPINLSRIEDTLNIGHFILFLMHTLRRLIEPVITNR